MFLLSNGVWGVTAGYPKGMALGTQKPKDMNIIEHLWEGNDTRRPGDKNCGIHFLPFGFPIKNC